MSAFHATILYLAASCAVAAARAGADHGATRVGDISFENARPVDIIETKAQRYHVVTGFSGVQVGGHDRGINVFIRSGELRDALDAVVAADPTYAWREAANGGLRVSVAGVPSSLTDVRVTDSHLKDANRGAFDNLIISLPEVQGWLTEYGCSANHFYCPRGPLVQMTEHFSVGGRGVTVGDILDETAQMSGTYDGALFSMTLHHAA